MLFSVSIARGTKDAKTKVMHPSFLLKNPDISIVPTHSYGGMMRENKSVLNLVTFH